MKTSITYIAALLLLAACSSENIVIEPATDTAEETAGIGVRIEAPVGLGDEFISRASLTYDDDNDIMAFKWGDDCIGVFPYVNASNSSQQKFSQLENDPRNTNPDPSDPLLRYFETEDKKVVVVPNSQYVAYMPYDATHSVNYTNIPVSYTGQRQIAPVDFSNYWNNKNDEAYKTSQQDASAHLSQYDYLCSSIATSDDNGSIHFDLKRMGAIVRFWIRIDPKNNYVYDELQLVNNSKEFTTEATMDAEAQTLTPTATGKSHVMTLKLGAENAGWDMSIQTNNGTKSTTPFYDYYNGTYTGYIMAYMMLAPINLQGDDVEHCELYLIAHEKANPENKHYFKATGLSKPNLQPNSFYKWTIIPAEPIEFSNITVEEWREGTTFDNNGAGTGTW